MSVCSGIEAASVSWGSLGWDAVAFSEIDPFCKAVLNKRYAGVPNYGSMLKFKRWPDACVDLLVGGTPCQSFSSAGLRKGLDDPRGNLTLAYLGVAARYHPRWLLYENVPGILSDKTGAFASLLGGMAELGYGWAYRVLDAQFFGVPQKRRRVFLVGYQGDFRRAAAVLFEQQSMQGATPETNGKGTNGQRVRTEVTGKRSRAAGTPANVCDSDYRDRGDASVTCPVFALTHNDDMGDVSEGISPTMRSASGGVPCLVYGDTVRRMTPLECERLQGFPGGYTDVEFHHKSSPFTDTCRYAAIGNSMAVPVMRWIGERIDYVDRIP
jgi:DNA (cytosine-5)-methyltransferase 1